MKTTTSFKVLRALRLVKSMNWTKWNGKRQYEYRIPFCIVQCFFESLCTQCIGEWSKDRKSKIHWWFPVASKIEFWFRNRERYDMFQLKK